MMDVQTLLSSPIVVRVGWTLLHSVWEGAAVCAAAMVALRLMRRATAAGRYALACMGMVLMAALPAGTFWLMAAPQKTGGGGAWGTTAQVVPADQVAAITDGSSAKVEVEGNRRFDGEGGGKFGRKMGEALLPYGVTLWVAGVLLLSLWRLGGWIAVQRLRVVGTMPAAVEVQQAMRRMAGRLGVRRVVRLAASSRLDVPVVLGFFKPVILFPPALLAGLSMGQIEAILAHELAHVRRHDYVALLVQTGVETLLFYHPGVWWLSRQIGLERELCCDDIAAEVSGDRRGYAGALVAIEGLRAAVPALGATGSGGGEMMIRIGRLMGVEAPLRAPRDRIAGLALMGVLALIVSMSLTAKGQAETAGTVTVRVKNESGTPVAGATVHVLAKKLDVTVRTDSSGMAKVAMGVEPRAGISLEASADGYTRPVLGWRSSVVQGTCPSTFDILLEKTVPIGGLVVDQHGRPLAGAQVMIVARKKYADSEQTLLHEFDTVTTDAQGRWDYGGAPAQVDEIDVAAAHAECLDGNACFELKPFTDLSALHQKSATMKLMRGDVLVEGIIKGPDGKIVAGATVEYGEDRVASNVIPPFSASKDGTFKLGVAAGEVVITVKAKGYAPELQRVQAASAPVKLIFDLKPAQRVSGTIVDEEGKAVGGVEVNFDSWREARTLGEMVMTDGAGRWSWEGAPGDEMFVDVLPWDYACNRHVRVKAGEANVIKLMKKTVLRGMVVDAVTGEAVKVFQVKEGFSWVKGTPITWITWDDRPEITSDALPGSFEIQFAEQKYPEVMARVEAVGYVSMESPRITMDGKTTDFTFRLSKSSSIQK